MSPEDRAQKVADYLADWLNVGVGDITVSEIASAIRAAETEATAPLVEAIRWALGTMQDPMARMQKACVDGRSRPCDHRNLRDLEAAMRRLQDVHDRSLTLPLPLKHPEVP